MTGSAPLAHRNSALAVLLFAGAGCVSKANFQELKPPSANSAVTRVYDPSTELLGPKLTDNAKLATEISVDPTRIAEIMTATQSPSLNCLRGLSVTTQFGGALDLQLNPQGAVSAKVKVNSGSREFSVDGTWKIRAVESSDGTAELELIVQVSKFACLDATISIREVRGERTPPSGSFSPYQRKLLVSAEVQPGPLAKIFDIPGIVIPGGLAFSATDGATGKLSDIKIATSYELLRSGSCSRQQVDDFRNALTYTGDVSATLYFSPLADPLPGVRLGALPPGALSTKDVRVFLWDQRFSFSWWQLAAVDRGVLYGRGDPPPDKAYRPVAGQPLFTASLASCQEYRPGSTALVYLTNNTLPTGRAIVQDSRYVEPGGLREEALKPWDLALRGIEELLGKPPNSFEFVFIASDEMRSHSPLAAAISKGGMDQIEVANSELLVAEDIKGAVLQRVLYDVLGSSARPVNAENLENFKLLPNIGAISRDVTKPCQHSHRQYAHDVVCLVAAALNGTLPKLLERLSEQERVVALVALEEVTRPGSNAAVDAIRTIIAPVISETYQRLGLTSEAAMARRAQYLGDLKRTAKKSDLLFDASRFSLDTGLEHIFGVDSKWLVCQINPHIAADEAGIEKRIESLLGDPIRVAKLLTVLAWRQLAPEAQAIDPATFSPDSASEARLLQKLIDDDLIFTPEDLYWSVRIMQDHNFRGNSHLVADYYFGRVVSVPADTARSVPDDMGVDVTERVRRVRAWIRDALAGETGFRQK